MPDENPQSSGLKIVTIDRNPHPISKRVLVGVPTLGNVRVEWATVALMNGFFLRPTNCGANLMTAVDYDVPNGRNRIVETALSNGFDWVIFLDDDTIPPADYFLRFWDYMLSQESPIVAGLYYTKSSQPEPLVYRGRGNGPYYDWKHGDKLWVDGCGMGCTAIHTSIFRAMKPPWFQNLRSYKITPEGMDVSERGTEDLDFLTRLIDGGIIEKAGWTVPDPKLPVLLDTGIFAKHIDASTGDIYPDCRGEEHLVNHRVALAKYELQREREKKAS